MKEIKMYESFDGLRFEKSEDCEKYEAERIPKIQTEGVEWYDKNFQPLEMNVDNWNKVKFLKLEDHETDLNFCDDFCTALYSMDKNLYEDEKLNNYCDMDIYGKTLLIWDEDKKEWCYFEDILNDFYKFTNFVENCKKIKE